MGKSKNEYINREISWLQFNSRVLQESEEENVPLIERLRFIGIFSNNLDEFFKVRYAAVKRIVESGKSGKSVLGGEKAKNLLKEIAQIVVKQQEKSLAILRNIKVELAKENIYIINETEVSDKQAQFIKKYFQKKVNPQLITILLNNLDKFPTLKDTAAYLAVKMELRTEKEGFLNHKAAVQHALIEIPKGVDRFVKLPKEDGKNYIIILDDLIRYCLDDIFTMFEYDQISANMIKITRDAELDLSLIHI